MMGIINKCRQPSALRTGPLPVEGTLAEYSGGPRSVIWRGAAIHLRAVGGNRAAPDLHSHFAIQLTIGVCHKVSLRRDRRGVARLAGGWLLGSDQPHWMSGNGPGATIFLDPLSGMGRQAAARIDSTGVVALTRAQYLTVRCELAKCWARGWQSADLQRAVMRIVDLVAPAGTTLAVIDPRVQAVIDELLKDSGENASLADLARRVGLSESHMAHLFRREVGIPMRQYRIWLRMEKAVIWITQGSSLTEAAHLAGFADSSQFCRICRRMTGNAPSSLPKFEISSQS